MSEYSVICRLFKSGKVYEGTYESCIRYIEKYKTGAIKLNLRIVKNLIPLPVSFLEWVSFEKYMRLNELAGHKWFKVGNANSYTTAELFDLFCKEMNDEAMQVLNDEYKEQLEIEAKNFGGL